VPTRLISRPTAPRPKFARPQERVDVVVWISHSDNGAYIEVYAIPQRVRVHFVEELYAPGDFLESAKICREIAELRLSGHWRAFLQREDVRVIGSHFVDRRRPSEEAYRLWRLEALRFIEDLPRKYPTLFPPKDVAKDREHV